jgi:hypothetical protein
MYSSWLIIQVHMFSNWLIIQVHMFSNWLIIQVHMYSNWLIIQVRHLLANYLGEDSCLLTTSQAKVSDCKFFKY